MTRTATAALIHEPKGKFTLEEIELDDPRDNEILVRIEASGVCHTDTIAQYRLPLPAVLGHEGTGIVEAVGKEAKRVQVGQRVVISYAWCGQCPQCIGGHAYRCEQVEPICFGGVRLDGSHTMTLSGRPVTGAFFQQSSFATHSITLERDVVPVAHAASPELLAAIPCGVQTGAGAILNSLRVGCGQSLAIIGAGAVGLSALMAGKLVGASPLIAVDRVDCRLALASELGATHVIDAREGGVAARIREICPRGADFSLDTTGNEQALDDAIECLGMGAVCGIVTAPHHGKKYPFTPFGIFRRSARLQGIIQGSALPNLFLPRLIEMQRQGRFPYERLIRTYDFADINKAFDDAEAGVAIKPVLKMKW